MQSRFVYSIDIIGSSLCIKGASPKTQKYPLHSGNSVKKPPISIFWWEHAIVCIPTGGRSHSAKPSKISGIISMHTGQVLHEYSPNGNKHSVSGNSIPCNIKPHLRHKSPSVPNFVKPTLTLTPLAALRGHILNSSMHSHTTTRSLD